MDENEQIIRREDISIDEHDCSEYNTNIYQILNMDLLENNNEKEIFDLLLPFIKKDSIPEELFHQIWLKYGVIPHKFVEIFLIFIGDESLQLTNLLNLIIYLNKKYCFMNITDIFYYANSALKKCPSYQLTLFDYLFRLDTIQFVKIMSILAPNMFETFYSINNYNSFISLISKHLLYCTNISLIQQILDLLNFPSLFNFLPIFNFETRNAVFILLCNIPFMLINIDRSVLLEIFNEIMSFIQNFRCSKEISVYLHYFITFLDTINVINYDHDLNSLIEICFEEEEEQKEENQKNEENITINENEIQSFLQEHINSVIVKFNNFNENIDEKIDIILREEEELDNLWYAFLPFTNL